MLNNTSNSNRDVEILELKLVSSNGRVADLKNIFNSINIYEDIFQPVITGTIFIQDGINILADYAIHGNEYLYITFGRPGETLKNQRYTKVFRIYKISDREKAQQSQVQNYILHFCSEELVFSNQQSISRAYNGGNTLEYVANICLYDLQVPFNKLVDFSKSSGPTEFVLTRKKPLDAIEYFTKNSYSDSRSPFLFFENKEGFNFLSLEALYKKNSITTINYSTAKYSANSEVAPFVNSTDINTLKFNQNFDVAKATREGLYSSKLYTLDLIRQKYVKNEVSLLNSQTAEIMIDGFFPFNDAKNRREKALYEEFDSKVRYWLTNKGNTNLPYFISKNVKTDESHIEEILAQREMQIEIINNTELHCVVPGNPQYSAGYTVNVNIPAFTRNLQNEQVKDPYYSGKYLITAVRHVIVPGSLQTILELSKNSLGAPLDLSAGGEYKKAQKL
jgi:hypothetical protein